MNAIPAQIDLTESAQPTEPRRMEGVYLGLTVLGAVLPWTQFIPWVKEHGLDLRRMLGDLTVNRISKFFGLDTLMSGVVLLVLASTHEGVHGRQRWLVAAGTVLVGPSFGLPLHLWLRERNLRSR